MEASFSKHRIARGITSAEVNYLDNTNEEVFQRCLMVPQATSFQMAVSDSMSLAWCFNVRSHLWQNGIFATPFFT